MQQNEIIHSSGIITGIEYFAEVNNVLWNLFQGNYSRKFQESNWHHYWNFKEFGILFRNLMFSYSQNVTSLMNFFTNQEFCLEWLNIFKNSNSTISTFVVFSTLYMEKTKERGGECYVSCYRHIILTCLCNGANFSYIVVARPSSIIW